jgi:hypothetical protein
MFFIAFRFQISKDGRERDQAGYWLIGPA